MFGIGMPEFILIAVVALIVFGPKKLPDLAKSMGKAVREFKKATSELKETMQVDTELSEVKQAFTELHSEVNHSIRAEAERPATQAAPAADPAPSIPAPPPPADGTAFEPSPAAKLEELKKAFETWSASKTAETESGDPGPKPGSAEPPQPPKAA